MPNRNQTHNFIIEAVRHLKKPLFKSMAHLSHLPSNQRETKSNYAASFTSSSKYIVLSLSLLVLQFSSRAEGASFITSNSRRHVNTENSPQPNQLRNFRFIERYNEHDGGVSILDDGTVRLSLAIDDEPAVSAPSLSTLEPRVYLRVSGESGMIPQYPNELVPDVPISQQGRKDRKPNNIQFHRPVSREEEVEESVEDDRNEEEDEMSDNYHHHFPYIESYREKYVRTDPSLFLTTTPRPRTTLPSSRSSPKQEWSDIIAQVTTPSSFNEINSSASEHRLADFHFRANLPSYLSNKYHSYSEEDLENVADLDDEHSKYFVKTRPRSVTTSGTNIYNNFYYEPPSFSTKSVPIPVKTNKETVVFASLKPTQNPHHFSHHDQDLPQQDAPMTTSNSSEATDHSNASLLNYVKEDIETVEKSTLDSVLSSRAVQSQPQDNYFENERNLKHSASNNPHLLKSSSETLDVSTSQSILSKVTLNNPHLFRHPQFVIIKSDYDKTAADTPRNHNGDEITLTSIKLASAELDNQNNEPNSAHSEQTTTEPSTDSLTTTSTTPSSITTTTTESTSIPGVPGVDYPTLGEIPQTSFDCKNQRYKGFFADIDTKCQAWHYCDFTDSHSTFLCPNGTLFSQVLLTCDWWFNVNCDQARQLYVLNERLYRYIKPPKPSFPEDFVGEHVDKWLLQQFTNGYLPKVRKKSKAKLVSLPPPTTSSPPTQKDE